MFSGLLSTSLHGVGFVQDRHKFNDTRHGGLNEMANSVNSLAPGISWCDFKNVICNHALLIGVFRSSYDNVLRWMPQDPTDDKSTLVHVMACCLMAPSHYLNQCWPRSPKPYGVSRPQWVNKGIFWKIFDIPASRMLKGGGGVGGTAFTLSIHPSVDRIMSALYLPQNLPDLFHVYRHYQPTPEGVSHVESCFVFSNLKICKICWTHYMTWHVMTTLTYDSIYELDLGLCIFFTKRVYPRLLCCQPDLVYSITLKFVSGSPIDNKSALVQVMVRCQNMMTNFTGIFM